MGVSASLAPRCPQCLLRATPAGVFRLSGAAPLTYDVEVVGGWEMILAALIGVSLVTTVSLDNAPASLDGRLAHAPASMSAQQKSAMLRRLIRSATDCVVRAVAADPRFQGSVAAADVSTLIVESVESCADPMRAMIDAHDRLYGEGSGEAFFMGPYLDVLPATVAKWARENHL